jgi:glyoxylate/succinic semialdehyde reductase
MMNAFSEGLTLAERSGLNPGTLLDVLVSYCDDDGSC